MRCSQGDRGVVPRGDHASLCEEAIQRVAEGGEEGRVQGPVAELSLTHALQQVWMTRQVYVCPVKVAGDAEALLQRIRVTEPVGWHRAL